MALRIETERLVLRQWREEDFPAFAALSADERVMEFFPATLSREESDAMVERCRGQIAERGWGFWAVEHRPTGEFAGLIGLNVPTANFPFLPCVEIGWRLARPFWGQGLATEGARAALAFGFETLKLDEIVAFTAMINCRSRGVMVRLGMRDAGEPFEHPKIPEGHPLRSHVLYRLRRQDAISSTGTQEQKIFRSP